MQIHVVSRGQSIYRIAQAYGITPQAIISANQLSNPSRLVVGQALVIPIQGSYHWVQPGETLFSIAQRFGISYQQLAQVNRITPGQPLRIGTKLYIPPRPKRRAEFNAYIEPRKSVTEALRRSAEEAAPRLTYLAPFSFQIQRDGSLKAPPLDNLRAIADRHNVTLMMVVTNLENDQFSAELGHIILTNTTVQNNLLNNIIRTAQQLGFRDIHFDIEHLRETDREAYNRFLQTAAERIHQQGWLISSALAPKTSGQQTGEWYTAHDYPAHGRIVDFVVIMSYEWGWSGGPPMPVSPIDQVERVMQYAISEIPSSKILMGQNLYGYDWTLPYVPGGRFARAISPQAAIDLAARYNQAISYDQKSQAPHFSYWDEQGNQHVVWFEDARSIQAKFNLVKELGLRGVSYWKLGLPFPQNWLLIDDNFQVTKR